MRGRGARRDYTMDDARADLEMGVHPDVVASRLGVLVGDLLELADAQGWPVSYKRPEPDQILDAYERIGA